MTARLAQRNGFGAVWASGFSLATSHAVPDASVLSMSESLAAVRMMRAATDLPIIADCDTGFEDTADITSLVQSYEAAGVSAVCIEDKAFPKYNSFLSAPQTLETTSVFSAKIEAAKKAQRGTGFMVAARTEAFIAGLGARQAIARAEAYVNAGADMILVHSKASSPHEIYEFMELWDHRSPVAVIPTSYHGVTIDELGSAGIAMVIYAHHAMRAAARAVNMALRSIIDAGTTTHIEKDLATLQEVFEIQGATGLRGSRSAGGEAGSRTRNASKNFISPGDGTGRDTV
ncbi:phosphoenolpyruvate mutase [Thermomonospora echinospora]|uniref:Phosphoenolpyruvate mutase n=2 Tax=Thermomonospora echinospora TaxID=1992 RepID=A0A1H6DXH6_9ACTN|nr:phosphoenolpyruvate mutase [Thermomonospora echinospora]